MVLAIGYSPSLVYVLSHAKGIIGAILSMTVDSKWFQFEYLSVGKHAGHQPLPISAFGRLIASDKDKAALSLVYLACVTSVCSCTFPNKATLIDSCSQERQGGICVVFGNVLNAHDQMMHPVSGGIIDIQTSPQSRVLSVIEEAFTLETIPSTSKGPDASETRRPDLAAVTMAVASLERYTLVMDAAELQRGEALHKASTFLSTPKLSNAIAHEP
ncbi:uncharacterized protein CLUP02_12707 [Colletotrichum lupini]|uniref:Uncharacterized protein n=1 Tax=Colletotrichum lupini TaxID=145971 RepID=A0A9Q8T1R1_9PEZI|nr:uncharacterized protein CLUP02_12707 [Colletotrichum lupini]UQC87205.1 hypothetical protein CLUP02_12707 [Colletotrichum lupini]